MFSGSYYGAPLIAIIGASVGALIIVIALILACVMGKKKPETPVLGHVNHNDYKNYSSYTQNPTLALPISTPPVVNIV
jgi:hypothetical protein